MIIAFVILVTSISFTLGLFVGKKLSDSPVAPHFSNQTDNNLSEEERELVDLIEEKEEEMTSEPSEEADMDEQEVLVIPDSEREGVENAIQQAPVATKDRGDEESPYSIQVAALRSYDDAKRMEEDLRRKGFHNTTVKQFSNNQGIFYKVRLKGFQKREDALTVLSELERHEINGFIVEEKNETDS